jgi:hypothetical protein
MNARLCVFAILGILCLSLTGEAQWGRPYYGGYGGGYGYGGYGATTAAGSAAYGMSQVIQASGEAQLNNSQAAKNYQEARSMEYDNRIKGTQTYFEMRKMNQAYTAAERSKPMTTEEAFRAAKEAAPKRLSPSQLDPLTGAIAWPVLLRSDDFKGGCATLEALFAERETKAGGIGGNQYTQIQEVTDILLAKLKANISQYSPDEYIKAKKFLESLAYEARFAAA